MAKLTKDGQPFEFEMLLVQPDFERVVLPFQRNLTRLGIGAGAHGRHLPVSGATRSLITT